MRNTVVAGVLGLLILTGCGMSQPTSSPSSQVGEPTSAATSAPVDTAVPEVPEPDAAEKANYLTALKHIDPGLVVNEERALRRGSRVCERILRGSDGGSMSLEKYTVEELSGGNATIDEAQAKKVIAAVKVWCKPV